MTWPLSLPFLVVMPLSFAAGLLVGLAYFRALRITADLIVARSAPMLTLLLTLGRIACLGAVLYAAVLVSGLALMAALAGVVVARTLMIRRMREAEA